MGERPSFILADGLPLGDDLDPATAELTWTGDQEGENVVSFAATDRLDGRDEEIVASPSRRPPS